MNNPDLHRFAARGNFVTYNDEGDPMNIREAVFSDLDAIERLYDDIHTAEETGSMTIGWIRGVYPTRETAESAILREDMYVMEEGEILGAGVVNRIQVDVYSGAPWEYETDKVCVLHTLVISPKHAGKGYGRAFVSFYEQWAAEHGLPELRIDTNARNAAARRMYKKMGYKEIAVVPTVFNGIPGVDLVLLEKTIHPKTDIQYRIEAPATEEERTCPECGIESQGRIY